MLKSGDMLDHTYQIVEPIGEGGGGVVYRAHHTRLQKDVVVKRIKEAVKGTLDSRAEADILKKLKHTYLPQVLDFLELEGQVYTVMDFVPGRSFSQELRDGKSFTQKQVIKWAGQLCEALAYLHKQKPPIIHSDIKPANVMLTPDGDVCLIDFNISQLFEGGSSVALGRTDGYAPPEQYGAARRTATLQPNAQTIPPDDATDITSDSTIITGEDNDKTEISASALPQAAPPREKVLLDEKSDIYALGATLYHILTGEKPNTAIYGVKPVRSTGVAVSDGLEYIITKAMQADPKKRFASAEEMLKAIKNIKKLDGAYKKQRARQNLSLTLLVLLLTISIVATHFGYQMLLTERVDRYNSLITGSVTSIENSDWEQAAAFINEAKKLYTDKPGAYYAQALGSYKQRQYQEAIGIVELSQKQNLVVDSNEAADSLWRLHYIAAASYMELEQNNEACSYFATCINAGAKSSDVYRDYAIALARNGDAAKAGEILKLAIENNLTADSVYLVEGEIYYTSKEIDKAQRSFEAAINTSEQLFIKERAYIFLARILKEKGDIEAELETINKAIAELPQANTLLLTEMQGEAYTLLIKKQPQNKQALTEKAIESFSQLISRGYNRYYIVQNIAYLHQNINQYDKALEYVDQLIELEPNNYLAYMQRCFVIIEQQSKLANEQRNYNEVLGTYETAKAFYESSDKNGQDPQMLMLADLVKDIKAGGW